MNFNGSKIKDFREKLKLSQEELAEKARVSRVTISQLESGTKTSTSIDILLAVAKALNRPVQDFFMS